MSIASVAELMTTNVRSVSPTDVVDHARAVLQESHVGAVPVISRDGAIVGIVSNHDLSQDWNAEDPLEPLMTTDVVSVGPETSATDAAAAMLMHQVHHLVVVDSGGATVGVISSFDLLRALAGEVEQRTTQAPSPRHAPKVGDSIVIRGHAIGTPERRGRIVEIKGAHGAPPYMVQWLDDPHDEPHAVLFFPGPDADLEGSS